MDGIYCQSWGNLGMPAGRPLERLGPPGTRSTPIATKGLARIASKEQGVNYGGIPRATNGGAKARVSGEMEGENAPSSQLE